MDIQLNILKIDGSALTLRLARQFPTMGRHERELQAESGQPKPPILGRVLSHTLFPSEFHDYDRSEYGLVLTDTGPAWVHPFYIGDDYKKRFTERKIWWDEPSESPFIILR